MKAVIYARYSSDGQREESIEGQLRECKEYADRHNITIVATYIDRAQSARTDDRPQFQKMISDSTRKQFDVVLVWKLDRFARNRLDSASYRAILKRNGVNVISAKENISEGSEGIILEAMLEGIAEYYECVKLRPTINWNYCLRLFIQNPLIYINSVLKAPAFVFVFIVYSQWVI